MELLKPKPFDNKELENWHFIGKGGFGLIYKVKHKKMGHDVAIKLLYCSDMEGALFKEAKYLETSSSDYVLRIYGIYEGIPPFPGEKFKTKGIVTEFMRRGSIESIQKKLNCTPPVPLAFRLAHEVALGINFLHSMGILHRDLKPSNVMLSESLNAKLADFGLSTYSSSANTSFEEKAANGGTLKYMPPEAFDPSYTPSRFFDIYSFGILVWSIFTGEEPYKDALDIVVEMKVPEGQRPPLDHQFLENTKGLEDLKTLISKCWEGEPSKRPTTKECIEVTKKMYLMHENGINQALYQVLEKLDSEKSEPPEASDKPSLAVATGHGENGEDRSGFIAQQSVVDDKNNVDKVKFVDMNRASLIKFATKVMEIVDDLGDMVQTEACSFIKVQRTSQMQMTELYCGPLHSGGTKVKAAFYDALKKHEPQLVRDLGMTFPVFYIHLLVFHK
ncbi:receptor-interacting serine/threonine-protein kinase 3 isoform X1 [Oryzias melastigma]|nr:receptor-interacting serine/threonine-protein kinase 3 isoform X1 [Oryzias melastigma]XP_036068333.1 receptor-interacting serine/threonine-protein kinase 3 isoform X1 [Oryzias melastigma]